MVVLLVLNPKKYAPQLPQLYSVEDQLSETLPIFEYTQNVLAIQGKEDIIQDNLFHAHQVAHAATKESHSLFDGRCHHVQNCQQTDFVVSSVVDVDQFGNPIAEYQVYNLQ